MESAFGIDHGYEVEKAFSLGALRPVASAFKMGAQGAKSMAPLAAKPGVGGAFKAGQGARKVGQFAMANKKPLGIGAGVGVGGGLLAGRRRQV